MISRIKTFVTVALIAGFGVWCAVRFHADIAALSLRPVVYGWDAVVIAAVLSLANYLFRSLRWQSYLKRLGYGFPFRQSATIFVSGFAFTLSPGKLGELVRARYYQPLGVPLSVVTAAFLVERVLDLFAMIALACLSLSAFGRFAAGVWIALAIVAAAVALLLAGPRIAEMRNPPRRFPVRLPRRGADALAGALRTLSHGKALLHPSPLAYGAVLAIAAWGAEGIGLFELASIFEPHRLDLAHALGIYSGAIVAGVLSFLPAGLGTTEAVMATLLTVQGFPVSEAMLVTLLCRLVTLWLAVLLGWMAVFGLRASPEVAS